MHLARCNAEVGSGAVRGNSETARRARSRRAHRRELIGFALALACLAASSCGGSSSRGSAEDSLGVRDRTVSFGPVKVGARVERTLVVDGAVSLQGQRDVGPFTVSLSTDGVASTLTVAFEPARVSDVAADIGFRDGVRHDPMVLHLRGYGVPGCPQVSPETLEFPAVKVGEDAVMAAFIENPSETAFEASIAAIESAAFELAPGFAPGKHLVPPASEVGFGELSIPIRFRPAVHGEVSATWTHPGPGGCAGRTVRITGFGVSSKLTCEPAETLAGRPRCAVTFDSVLPGQTTMARIAFRNRGSADVDLNLGDIAEQDSGENAFAVATKAVRIASGGVPVEVEIAFSPTRPGWHTARVPITTSADEFPSGAIDLLGGCVGPKIEVQPLAIDFGTVSRDRSQKRVAKVANAGIGDGDLAALRFGIEQDGSWRYAEPEVVGSDEIRLNSASSTDFHSAIGPGSFAYFAVDLTPYKYGRKTATLRIASNDPVSPVVEIPINATVAYPGACALDVSPPALNFGPVPRGGLFELPVVIRNRAADPEDTCLISGLELAGDPASCPFRLSATPSAATLLGGEELVVQVKFEPAAEGCFESQLEFVSSSPIRSNGVVKLTGVSYSLPVEVLPRNLEFGEMSEGCPASERGVAVTNVSGMPQSIEWVQIEGGTAHGFSYVQRAAHPVDIAPTQTRDLQFKWTPNAVGDQNDIALVKIAEFADPLRVGLHGRASEHAYVTDRFEVDPPPKVDVLFVVDDSPAMADKAQSLARNFASFIHYAVQQKVDYHIAMTTTSVGGPGYANGRLIPVSGPNPRIITPSTPNKEQVFTQNACVGSSGNSIQKLLLPAELALSEPLLSGSNAGFYRPDAKLSVTVVSAAADKDTNAIADYVAFFLNLKGIKRRNDFSLSAIIPTLPTAPAGCSYDSASSGLSTRAKSAVQQTGGLLDEICNPDWSKSLEKLGTRCFGPRTTFFLSEYPDMTRPDPILIVMDGQPYPKYGAKGDKRWEYNSSSNAIEFDPLAVPDPGSTFSIEYWVRCPDTQQ